MTGDQSLDIAEKFEGVLVRQIRFEQKKVSIYEKAYTEELLLRMRAVDYLRRHEKKTFGSVRDITKSQEYEKDPFMTIPRTPKELFTRDKTKEELSWYWREDYDERVPRTAPYEIRKRFSSSSKEKDEIPSEEPTGDEGPSTKRAKTPPKDSEEEIQRRLQEWREAAAADRKRPTTSTANNAL